MRRVWVIGISGSGKTTLAVELARRLGVGHIELDAMHHGPDWAEPDLEQFRADVAAVVAGDGWVVDGGYQGKLGTMVPEAADTLIWLDLPLYVSMLRTTRRSFGRVLRRTELWNGNRETLRGLFWGRSRCSGGRSRSTACTSARCRSCSPRPSAPGSGSCACVPRSPCGRGWRPSAGDR
jgi:adenylate kinase family enzyme